MCVVRERERESSVSVWTRFFFYSSGGTLGCLQTGACPLNGVSVCLSANLQVCAQKVQFFSGAGVVHVLSDRGSRVLTHHSPTCRSIRCVATAVHSVLLLLARPATSAAWPSLNHFFFSRGAGAALAFYFRERHSTILALFRA
ncbi:unnamed protein product, partial [Pylaiella littoralis]